MNVLFVGAGRGSWAIRGQQLAAALGGRTTSRPTAEDVAWADVLVLVKYAIVTHAAWLRSVRKPLVWDVLDCWAQPTDHGLDRTALLHNLSVLRADVPLALRIGATQAMADDIGGVYLSHHSRLHLVPTPARPVCRVVGYDGNPVYLEGWQRPLEQACQRRGWTVVINPADLSTVDVLVALRGGRWDGWVCRQWKSGVKLVNAMAAGRPVLMQDTAATTELQPDGTVLASPDELDAALDHWADAERRDAVVTRAQARAAAFTVDAVAAQYRTLLEGHVFSVTR